MNKMAGKKGSLNPQSLLTLLKCYAENSSIHGRSHRIDNFLYKDLSLSRNSVPAQKISCHSSYLVDLGDPRPNSGGHLRQQRLHRLAGRAHHHKPEETVNYVSLLPGPPSEQGRFSKENTQIDKSPSEPLILSPLPSIQWICSVHIPEGVFARIGICFPLNSTINHICGGEFNQKAEWLRQANSLLRGQGGWGGLQEIPRRWVSKLQSGEHTG